MKRPTEIRKIRKAMEKTQDEKRYIHTLGVAYTATALAMCYGQDLQQAETAGLLHDCAKCMDNKKKLTICKKYHISMTELEQRNPFLLHAKVGSFLAKNTYGIQDEDILNAILNHTTGRPNMSLLEKIIFIADYIEPSGKQAPNLAQIRALAFQDLDSALRMILRDTLQYLQETGGETDPMTQQTYDFYLKEEKKEKAKT